MLACAIPSVGRLPRCPRRFRPQGSHRLRPRRAALPDPRAPRSPSPCRRSSRHCPVGPAHRPLPHPPRPARLPHPDGRTPSPMTPRRAPIPPPRPLLEEDQADEEDAGRTSTSRLVHIEELDHDGVAEWITVRPPPKSGRWAPTSARSAERVDRKAEHQPTQLGGVQGPSGQRQVHTTYRGNCRAAAENRIDPKGDPKGDLGLIAGAATCLPGPRPSDRVQPFPTCRGDPVGCCCRADWSLPRKRLPRGHQEGVSSPSMRRRRLPSGPAIR